VPEGRLISNGAGRHSSFRNTKLPGKSLYRSTIFICSPTRRSLATRNPARAGFPPDKPLSRCSSCFQIAGSQFAALGDNVVADTLSFGQCVHSCALYGTSMHKNIFRAAFWTDESEALAASKNLTVPIAIVGLHNENAARKSDAETNNLVLNDLDRTASGSGG
jgi:hypothetical protein